MAKQWTVVLLALALMGCAKSSVTDLDSNTIQPNGIQANRESQQLKPDLNAPDLTPVAKIDESARMQANRESQQLQPGLNSPDLTPVAKIDESARMQANREKLITKLVEMNVFQKAEATGGVPRLWVGTKFRALDYALKQIYVSVYAQYVGDGGIAEPVLLYDGKTRVEIGRYSASYGGLKLF